VEAARGVVPSLPLIAGGKSFGGRMTSQAQAGNPLPGVRGLVFLGFPLHPPNEPSSTRAAHLSRIEIPMLFLQGSRDEFATQAHLMPVIETLGARARLELLSDADHSFHVPARSGRTDSEVRDAMSGAIVAFSEALSRDLEV
jgi:predicted alpha/beta-hydrolase family hydrolase